jgi:hypothetical protein
MSQNTYDPNKLIDFLIDRLHLRNDAALSRILEVAPPVISKIRHRTLPVGGVVLIRAHELTGIPTKELRQIMGDRRAKFRTNEGSTKVKATLQNAPGASAARSVLRDYHAAQNKAAFVADLAAKLKVAA